MNRFWYVCIATVLLLTSAGVSVPGTLAQGTSLPPEDLILRIGEDEQWMFVDSGGEKHVRETVQMLDGVPQVTVNEVALNYYEEHNVQTVLLYAAQIRPVINNYAAFATGVEMRVLTFPSEGHATAYQEGIFTNALEQDQLKNDGRNSLELMVDMPDLGYPTIGWTYQQSYLDANGNSVGDASGLRFHARHGSMLVTVRVEGQFVDFNFDLGFALLDHQMACVAENVVCDPVTLSEITPQWQFSAGYLFYVNDANEGVPARVVFPVEQPVRAPEMGAVFDASAGTNANTTNSTTTTRTTRTTRTSSSGDGTGTTRVTRTPRTSSSGESSGTTRTTRTVRSSNTATQAQPANATVIVATADVFEEPDTSADVLVVLAEGDRVTVTGEPELVGSTVLVPVVTEDSEEGWMLIQDVWKD